MSRWLLASLLGGTIVTGCLLPDVEVDPDLFPPDDPTANAGTGGAGLSVTPVGGAGGGGGTLGGDSMINPLQPGAGGTTDGMTGAVNQGGSGGSGGLGGAGGTGGTGGSGGAGAGGSSTAGAGGTAGDPIECDTNTDREAACIQYCAFYLGACEDNEANTYGGLNDCTMTCVTSLWPVGTGDQKGSICCRYLHANLARTVGVDPHCFHSAEVPSKGETGAGCALAPTP
jgi:hypothetical protein